jgi:hypothetical protein
MGVTGAIAGIMIIFIVAKAVDAQRTIDPKARIERCERVQTNVRWPAPVDQRLNELLEHLSSAGGEATRSQLLAALVVNAPTDGRELTGLLMAYRGSTARKVVLQRKGPIRVVERRRGRRPR